MRSSSCGIWKLLNIFIQRNEGTVFSQVVLGLDTPPPEEDAAFTQFIQELIIDPSTITQSTFDTLVELYPANDSSLGAPFNTGDSLFDRSEAWYTDNMFLSARRLLFQKAAPLQPLFGYFFTEFIPGNPVDLGGKETVIMRYYCADFAFHSLPWVGTLLDLWSSAESRRRRLCEPTHGLLHQLRQRHEPRR